MFRPRVLPFTGGRRRQRSIEEKLPLYLLVASAVGALGSIAGWIATYIYPAAFASSVSQQTVGDTSIISWIPQFPLIGTLAAIALAVRLFTESPISPRRSTFFSRASRIFEISVWDVPFIAGFIAAGLYYLPPVFTALTLGPAANPTLIGCAISRFCFSALAISHLGHAAYTGFALWNRRGWR